MPLPPGIFAGSGTDSIAVGVHKRVRFRDLREDRQPFKIRQFGI